MVHALALAAALFAQSDRPTGWDGSNPFNCVLQQAGFEAAVPDPGADPYCVEFDKRRQNVTEGGVVDFLSKEPARVAAATPKCFYFQSDHWRGSVVQDDGTTKTYEWDGHYFFDKARGEGGVWVTNFNVNGRTEDPSRLPGMPADIARHFGPGTGGVITRNDVEADPACVERAEREPEKIYAPAPGAAGPTGGPRGSCAPVAGGRVTRRGLGPVALGERDEDVRRRLGDPARVTRGWLRWCAQGGGVLMVAQPGDRSGELAADPDTPAVAVLTTSRGVALRGVRVGARARALRRAFPGRRRVARVGRTRIYRVAPQVYIGLTGRVSFLAVTRTRSPRAAALLLSRALRS